MTGVLYVCNKAIDFPSQPRYHRFGPRRVLRYAHWIVDHCYLLDEDAQGLQLLVQFVRRRCHSHLKGGVGPFQALKLPYHLIKQIRRDSDMDAFPARCCPNILTPHDCTLLIRHPRTMRMPHLPVLYDPVAAIRQRPRPTVGGVIVGSSALMPRHW
jgi:hypothetical protein